MIIALIVLKYNILVLIFRKVRRKRRRKRNIKRKRKNQRVQVNPKILMVKRFGLKRMVKY